MPLSRKIKIVLGVCLSLIVVRSLPYFAPIRSRDLPVSNAIEFSDRHGLPLGIVLSQDQNHTATVPLDQISPQFIQAILAAEDGRFYHHGALEIRSIVRSIIQAIETKKIISGASTITMQLARMLKPAPRNLSSKLQEVWFSWRIAAGMTKDEILKAYINHLPMGSNIYGVEAASRIYFDLPAAQLNLAQASLLAAIPNNPNHLNPYHWEKSLKERQWYVLQRMMADGYITEAQATSAQVEHLTIQPRQQGIIAAPHLLFRLAKALRNQPITQVQTTIDRPLQQFVEAQAKDILRNLQSHNVHQAAAIVIDNHTGEVLAYMGSIDYFNDNQLGGNDGVQALRQPGSTLKPFLYQLALKNRVIRPNTVLPDIPTHYAIPGAKIYSPIDYQETFNGPVRVRLALANSLNIPAVRVLEKVGVDDFLAYLQQLGFTHLTQSPEYYGLGLALGSGEVSLWELAQAYLLIARQGKVQPLITNLKQARDLYSDPPLPPLKRGVREACRFSSASKGEFECINPGDDKSWLLITDILSDHHARAKAFGVNSILSLPFPTAVKTGTSSSFRDTWTVGFSHDYTVATWIGNFNGEAMKQVSGVTGAAPLWARIMLHLHQDREPLPFSPPKGMIQLPICALSGLKPTSACPSVVEEYFDREDLADYQQHPDTFYQMTNGRSHLNLPPEYNQWLAKNNYDVQGSNTLKILTPADGDFFVIDRLGQKLELQAGGGDNQPLEWYLNGEKIATGTEHSFFWKMRPGSWTLEIKKGKMVDRVEFQVEVAKVRSSRRGFSVVKDELQ